jgi:thioredoxin-related protein
MKNKLIFILFFLIVVVPSGFAQLKTYSFQEAESYPQKTKAHCCFVHTSWCKYCKMMENITFKTQKLLAY